MDFKISAGQVHLIGDPHLGKKFEVGVPLHRRGEREASQFQHFLDELDVDCDVNVMVGDLFDNPYVSDDVVLAAGDAYLAAASRSPWVSFVAIAGNHDRPRNVSKKGAWDAFEAHVNDRLPNLIAVSKPIAVHGIMCYPWEWGVRSASQVRREDGIEAVVGHWDLKVFEGKDDHLCPAREILEAHGDVPVYGGHYHTPGIYPVDPISVNCTGSMEPYSHGEDPEGTLYITMTRDEAVGCLPGQISGKHVRVILAKGETLPEIDCLALTHIRSTEQASEVPDEVVTLETFNWKQILAKKLEPLDPVVQNFIKDQIPDATEE